jgi:hypothetical protein
MARAAMSEIGIVDVFEANTARAPMSSSIPAKTLCFTSRLSTTASRTTSTREKPLSSSVGAMKPSFCRISRGVRRFRRTCPCQIFDA